MENESASDALPPGSERELRRLRFADPAFEAAFGAVYAENSRIHLRWVLGLMLIIPTLGFVATLLRVQMQIGVAQTFWMLAIHLGVFLLTWSPWFLRLFQPVMALTCVVLGATLMARMLPAPAGVSVLLLASLYTYTLFRLRFVAAVLAYCSLIAFYLGYSLWMLRTPPGAMLEPLRAIVIANFLGMLAAYTLEHWSRRDFLLTRQLAQEREKSEVLLRNMMPASIADRLKQSSEPIADDHAEVSVLFADVADFTPFAAARPAREVIAFLNDIFSRFDRLVEQHGLEKIKTIGDCYMVIAGAPTPRADHLEALARLALAMQAEADRMSEERGLPVRFRMGLHTGPLVAGVIGERRFLYDVWGDTVNTSSRLESHGVPGRIQVTAEVAERLRDRFRLTHRGPVALRGKGTVQTCFLDGEQ